MADDEMSRLIMATVNADPVGMTDKELLAACVYTYTHILELSDKGRTLEDADYHLAHVRYKIAATELLRRCRAGREADPRSTSDYDQVFPDFLKG